MNPRWGNTWSTCYTILFIVLLFVATTGSVGVVSQATAESPVKITVKGPSEVQAGAQIDLSVRAATNQHSVSGVQYTLEYDPAIIDVTSVSKGGFLAQSTPTIVVTKRTNNTAGQSEYAEIRLGTNEAATNNGTVSDLTIQVTSDAANQTTWIRLTNIQLSDPDGQSIPTTTQNLSLSVNTPQRTTRTTQSTFEESDEGQDKQTPTATETSTPGFGGFVTVLALLSTCFLYLSNITRI